MILGISSDLPTFKTLTLGPGLNVILSSKAPGSTEGKTRNSAGKTSFVELVQFLLGAKCDPDSLFRNAALVDSTFTGTFLIDWQEVVVRRSGSAPNRIVVETDAERLGLAVKVEKATGATIVSNKEWNEFLGHKMFALPQDLDGSAYGASFSPGFRPMFSYFVRREGSGGFVSPELQAKQQQRWDWQVNLSYLLGLDWRVSFDLHKVRQRERTLDELRKATKDGALGQFIGTAAELRPQVVNAADGATRLREQLDRFEVVDSYRELSQTAAAAKAEMQAIARRAVSLEETLSHLRSAIEQEHVPPSTDLERLYQSVGVELPGIVSRRFEDVAAFHRSVVANRRAYLTGEIARAEEELRRGRARSEELDVERAGILNVLRSGGALDDFVGLQKTLASVEAEAAALRERLKAAEALERETTELEIDRSAIKLRLIENLRGGSSNIEEAMLLIASSIRGLYEDRSGQFEVQATDNGPEFRISIPGDRGTGISKMEIFSLDHALFSIWSRRGAGPGFLVHDSHLFDGVDARQIARALRIGKAAADAHSGQYVVCMNSDIFESLVPDTEIDPDRVIVRPVLSDAEDGGLFGFRFD